MDGEDVDDEVREGEVNNTEVNAAAIEPDGDERERLEVLPPDLLHHELEYDYLIFDELTKFQI